jgi:hypothetical protein
MRMLLFLLLAVAGCAGPPPRQVVTEVAPVPAGEAPRVSVGGTFHGYYGARR